MNIQTTTAKPELTSRNKSKEEIQNRHYQGISEMKNLLLGSGNAQLCCLTVNKTQRAPGKKLYLPFFTQQFYNKQVGMQSLLPFSNPKINLCSEQPYDNKLDAQLQSSQATQNQYIFKQKLHGQ